MEKLTPKQIMENDVMPVAVVSTTPFKTPYNAKRFEARGERNDGTSQTVPDQALTVAELVHRFTHGQSLGGSKAAIFDDDLDFDFPPDWEKFDLSEKVKYMREKQAELDELQRKYAAEQNKLIQDEKEKEIERRVDEKLKARRKVERQQSQMTFQPPAEGAQ